MAQRDDQKARARSALATAGMMIFSIVSAFLLVLVLLLKGNALILTMVALLAMFGALGVYAIVSSRRRR